MKILRIFALVVCVLSLNWCYMIPAEYQWNPTNYVDEDLDEPFLDENMEDLDEDAIYYDLDDEADDSADYDYESEMIEVTILND